MMSICSVQVVIQLLLIISHLCEGASVWPQPQQIHSFPDQVYTMDSQSFSFLIDDKSPQGCDVIIQAITRYKGIIFSEECIKWSPTFGNTNHSTTVTARKTTGRELPLLYNLTISFRVCESMPHEDMDESYTLSVGQVAGEAWLITTTPWGVLRGLETFSQLVERDNGDNDGSDTFKIEGVSILDFPRFKYRGVLIDTSRHFIPVNILKQNLDAMAYNKFNVFHWHLVDDPSFPMESRVFPQLHLQGAFDPKTLIYRQEDIKGVIEYARLRGIRTIPEIDTPGHTLSWGKADSSLLTTCFNETTGFPSGTFGPLDPTKNRTYEFVQSVLKEVSQLFPDRTIHLGGDEVDFACWKSNPGIKQFMLESDIDDYKKLEGFYVQRIAETVIHNNLSRNFLLWQEVFDDNITLDRDTTIIHVWKWWTGKEWDSELYNVTAAGYKAILSSPWYLNIIKYGIDWPPLYTAEPLSFNGTREQKSLVLGGSVTMWTEFVDGSQLMSRTWPRASAVAERLWSSVEVNDPEEAVPRIKRIQCLMQGRGLRVEPINGPGYCACDYMFE